MPNQEATLRYHYYNGNRSISSEQLFEATRALFTVKDADGKLTVSPKPFPPLLTLILVPVIFVLPVATLALLLVKDATNAAVMIIVATVTAAAVIFMQVAIQMSSRSNGAYIEIDDAAGTVSLPRAKRRINKEDVSAIRMYMTCIKTRPTNVFSYKVNVATILTGDQEIDIIAYARKSSDVPGVAAAIAERIGCPLEMVDDIANADA